MSKNGFTILELLISFVIIALLSILAIISYSSILNSTEEKYYHSLESTLLMSANDYFQDNRQELPISGTNSVLISELISEKYVEQLKDKDGNNCSDGEVYVFMGDNKNYNYEVCLRCGNYVSSGTYCN